MKKFALLLACIAAPASSQVAGSVDPLTRPVAEEYSRQWLGPQVPVRLHGQSYFVGFQGLSIVLIRTSKGLILIDGAVPQAVGTIQANIRNLGFDPADIRLILSTEPHYDHAGGMAALARDSGATVLAGAPALAALRTGRPDRADPQHDDLVAIPGIARLRAVRDGEAIRLGNMVVTANATPGHTAGSMSWSWKSCEDRKCATLVFASSLNPISSDGYRFTDRPADVRRFRTSIDRVRGFPCDLLITSHPDGDLLKRMAATVSQRSRPPLTDDTACRRFGDQALERLEKRLANERAE